MVQKFMERNPAVKYAIENLTPLKQAASVEQVADYIVFISSPSASFINGNDLPIDASLTLPPPPPLSQS
jgi:NAD(P)-dependent dehydrogenase (short-subunit alcohol dehydrogenase family)